MRFWDRPAKLNAGLSKGRGYEKCPSIKKYERYEKNNGDFVCRFFKFFYDRTFLEYGGDVVYTKIKNKE